MSNTILKEIKADNLKARKEKNKSIASLLTTLVSEIEIVGKNNQRDTTEIETVKVIEKFAKNVMSTIELVSNTEELELELSLYKKYLPKKLSKEELTRIITDIITADSNINIGKIMGALKKNYNGTYDGKLASEIIKNIM